MKEAIEKYSRMLARDPRSRAFAPLAQAYRRNGNYDEAIKVLKKGIRYNPGYVLGHLVLAQCLFDQENYEDAIHSVLPFVESGQDNLTLQRLYAQCCERIGRPDEALEAYKLVLVINPHDQEAYNRVKLLEDELKQDVIIIQDRERSIDASTSGVDDWEEIPTSHSNTPASSAIKSAPQTPVDVSHTLVDLYLEQGHVEEALRALEGLHELYPEDQKTSLRLHAMKQELREAAVEEITVEDELVPEVISTSHKEVEEIERITQEAQTEEDGYIELLKLVDKKVRPPKGEPKKDLPPSSAQAPKAASPSAVPPVIEESIPSAQHFESALLDQCEIAYTHFLDSIRERASEQS